jgi:hypothetical protein
MNYKHSNSSKPIPGIFNKIEKPILLQSNCLKNRNLKHLLQILSKLSCIELAMAKKLSWLIPILKKLTPIFQIPNVSPQNVPNSDTKKLICYLNKKNTVKRPKLFLMFSRY